MKDFEYYNPIRIVFGTSSMDRLNALLPSDQKIMIVMGKGSIKKNGVYDRVKAALAERDHVEFWGIEPNPEYETCMAAMTQAKAEKVGFFLSVGGGSVLDATKFISAAMHCDADPWDILEHGTSVDRAVPLGCVLTLPATGSEVNGNAVISRRSKGLKLAFSTPLVMPIFSILDPASTLSLSERQTANGIVDAFVHVMEQYLTYDVNTPLQDRQAEAILQTLIEVAPRLKAHPDNLDDRATLMWCASNALNNLINCGTVMDWTSHVIGHEITALHGIDHARTLAMVLPAVMTVKRRQKGDKICQFARRVWGLQSDDRDALIDACIARTRQFFEDTGCPTSLAAYDLSLTDVEAIPRIFQSRQMVIGEHNDVDYQQVRQILQLCN